MKRLKANALLQWIRSDFLNDKLDADVQAILNRVRAEGWSAVQEYTRMFDHVELPNARIAEADLQTAKTALSAETIAAIQLAIDNIRRFAKAQKDSISVFEYDQNGITLGQTLVPVDRVGCYVPGGHFPLVSTALMTVIPAQEAGVRSIIVCSPPGPDGKPHTGILAACAMLGIDEVYALGGAQAIAAMAYGIDSLQAVDKIVGPGSKYVATAKKLVSHEVAIDFFAGPSEVLIIADELADPVVIACDLLSQAEHDPDARSILLTSSDSLIDQVEQAITQEVNTYPAESILHQSANCISSVKVQSLDEAVELSNKIAPEHLQLQVVNPDSLLANIRHYGSLFIGSLSPVALGDYASGTNHTLPTNGAARNAGGLSVFHFLKIQTWQQANGKGLRDIAPTISALAELEGLFAHKRSVTVRLESQHKN